MYKQIAIFFFACLVGISQATYLAAPLAAPSITTSAHVGNVQSVSRSYSHVPQTRFSRTDWNQPGSLITAPIFSPIITPTFGQIAVPGPTRYESVVIPRAPLVENTVSHIHGVAHVPTVAHVPAAIPAAIPVAAPVPVAAPAYGPAPVAVKGY